MIKDSDFDDNRVATAAAMLHSIVLKALQSESPAAYVLAMLLTAAEIVRSANPDSFGGYYEAQRGEDFTELALAAWIHSKQQQEQHLE